MPESVLPYRPRVVDTELDELVPGIAAIAIEGAKGVGKTATAARRAVTRVALDDSRIRALAAADPQALLDRPAPVLLDEWQRLPEVWDLVRRRVDAGAEPGSFLLTGSAFPPGLGTHSGAGRIVRLRMRPMSLVERGVADPTVSLRALLSGRRPDIGGETQVRVADYVDEICSGGLPGIRGLPPRSRRAQLDGYLQNVVDRDLEELDRQVRNPRAMIRWMEAYAAATATLSSYDRIRDAATPGESDKPARATTARYRDALERLWILDPVPAWRPTANTMARLGSSPKHHLVDPALAARLLGVDAGALLDVTADGAGARRDGAMAGHLFESLVTLDVRVYAQAAEARVGHFRSHAGEREVDLIVERGDHRVVAIEVKFGATVTDDDVRHLRWLQGSLGPDILDAVVVSTGPYAYRRRDGISVVPAALLGP